MNKKSVWGGAVVALLIAGIVICYNLFVAPTMVATFNYPDFMAEKFIHSNDNGAVKIDVLQPREAEKMKDYDIVLV